MHRSSRSTRRSLVLALALAACQAEGVQTTEHALANGLVHESYVVPTGDGPNQLRVHRIARADAHGHARRSKDAIVLMHGDFASFATSFTPMATWLAERGIDVWGIDRRWTDAPRVAPDLSDFDAMGLDQELDDIATALDFVRDTRRHGGAGNGKVTLAGFSRGGQLAYFYASREAKRPHGHRHVKGLVSLDVYASLADADTELRQFYCDMAAAEYELLADGVVNVDNEFQITVGQDAIDTPNEPSRWAPLRTARELMLLFVGKSYRFWPASPLYHLTAPVLDGDGNVTGLRASSEADITAWLANAAPQQSMRESADTDQVLCDPTAFDVPLSRIHVPLLSIAAAGGYGERANHSAAQVSSNDVTTRVVRQLPLEREAEDFGHADLLFAADAPTLVWQPLLAWLRAH